MIFIVDEKDVGLLADGSVKVADGDSVKVFVKDMDKAILSASCYNALKNLSIEFTQAASQTAMLFAVGCLVGAGEPITLVQMELPIPDEYKSLVKSVVKKEKAKKASKPRNPKPKKEDVKDVPADKPAKTDDVKPVKVPDAAQEGPVTAPVEESTVKSEDASDTDAVH